MTATFSCLMRQVGVGETMDPREERGGRAEHWHDHSGCNALSVC